MSLRLYACRFECTQQHYAGAEKHDLQHVVYDAEHDSRLWKGIDDGCQKLATPADDHVPSPQSSSYPQVAFSMLRTMQNPPGYLESVRITLKPIGCDSLIVDGRISPRLSPSITILVNGGGGC